MAMKWTFPKADSGQIKGLNDEGIERFKGDPIKSLAREICQNSLDAWDDKTVPVKLEFAEFEAEFPGKEDYISEIDKMLDYWQPTQQNDKGVITFLKKAKACLESQEHIPYLRISDSNTTGLTGILTDGSSWDNLLKRVGASDKPAGDGGSRGIGKAAPFACSYLRTVFYTTKNSDEENREAFQGVARLVGYKTGHDEEIMTGTSFYGDERCKASLDYYSLDSAYNRETNQTGTDIFIAGFNKTITEGNWADEIIKYAVDSFFYAIYKNKIAINAGGQELSNATLQQVIDDIIAKGQSFPGHAEQYYKVLTSNSDKAQNFQYEVSTAGRRGVLKLRLLVADDMTFRRIAMVRNTGMKIFDQKGISGSINFAGVLVVEGDELNHYLKTMEDATHENWSENNTDNPIEAKAFLKEIRKFCKDSLNSLIKVDEDEKIDTGLGDMLPLNVDAEDDAKRNQMESIDPAYKKISDTVEIKRKKRKTIKQNELEDDDSAEEVEDPSPGGSTENSGGNPSGRASQDDGGDSGSNTGDEEGEAATTIAAKKIPIAFIKFKTLCCDASSGNYRVVFIPNKSMEDCSLVLNMVTITNENVPPKIKKAINVKTGETLLVDENEIKGLVFSKNEKQTIVVEIDYNDFCSIEGEAYGLAK